MVRLCEIQNSASADHSLLATPCTPSSCLLTLQSTFCNCSWLEMLYGLCTQLDMRPGILSMTLEHFLDKMLVHLKCLSKQCAMNAARSASSAWRRTRTAAAKYMTTNASWVLVEYCLSHSWLRFHMAHLFPLPARSHPRLPSETWASGRNTWQPGHQKSYPGTSGNAASKDPRAAFRLWWRGLRWPWAGTGECISFGRRRGAGGRRGGWRQPS